MCWNGTAYSFYKFLHFVFLCVHVALCVCMCACILCVYHFCTCLCFCLCVLQVQLCVCMCIGIPVCLCTFVCLCQCVCIVYSVCKCSAYTCKRKSVIKESPLLPVWAQPKRKSLTGRGGSPRGMFLSPSLSSLPPLCFPLPVLSKREWTKRNLCCVSSSTQLIS